MQKVWRTFLMGTLLVIILNSACGALPRSDAAPAGTLRSFPTQALIPSSTAAAAPTALAPMIPITGENVVEMQCQFCVNTLTHVVFIFPDFAIFDVDTTTPVTCLTAEVVNGKRVLVCNGASSITFNLKICSDISNCLLFPVTLQPCPQAGILLATVAPMTPIYLTAINTLRAPRRPTAVGPQAPTQSTATPSPPAASSTEPPPRRPTDTPAPTKGHRNPTHTPKPSKPPKS